jgi:hypothetical protein
VPKISELTAATSVGPSDEFAIVQSGTTKRAATSLIGSYPRTDAEVTAGFTPVDYRYPVGHIARAGLSAAGLQNMIDFCESSGVAISAEGVTGTITATSTITIDGISGDLSSLTIEANGASVNPVIRYGTTTGDPVQGKTFVFPRVFNTGRAAGTWGSGVGILLGNVYSCNLSIPWVEQFEINVSAGGYNSGFAYNVVYLGRIYDGKVNVRLGAQSTSGWCNQNTWIGGRSGFSTGVFSTSGYTGTRHVLLEQPSGAGVTGPNTNTFIGTSVEDNGTAVPEYIIELRNSASYNQFINCRFEGSSDAVLLNPSSAAGVTSNFIIGGYQAFSLVFTVSGAGTALYNSVLNGRRNSLESDGFVLGIANTSGNTVAAPHVQGFAAATSSLGKDHTATDWRYRLYASGLAGKQAADTDPRIVVDLESGRIDFGGGSGATDTRLTRTAANQLSMADGDAFRVQGTWDGGALILGTYRLWVDSTGDLRIKNGAPASDTDGTVVGAQS